MGKDIVISIGGSVAIPQQGIDKDYLKKFNLFVRNELSRNRYKRFFIFIGGGHTAHEYQYTAERVIGKVRNNDLSWLGVHATRLNAHLIRTIFHDLAYPRVLANYDSLPNLGKYRVIVCAAWLPGATTDFDMVNLAKLLKVKEAYSLLNVQGIYNRDPKLFKEAKIIDRMKWEDYREMIGDWWVPNRQIPFDPFASKLAEDYGMKVFFLDGKNLKNLENVLEEKNFEGSIGTIIE